MNINMKATTQIKQYYNRINNINNNSNINNNEQNSDYNQSKYIVENDQTKFMLNNAFYNNSNNNKNKLNNDINQSNINDIFNPKTTMAVNYQLKKTQKNYNINNMGGIQGQYPQNINNQMGNYYNQNSNINYSNPQNYYQLQQQYNNNINNGSQNQFINSNRGYQLKNNEQNNNNCNNIYQNNNYQNYANNNNAYNNHNLEQYYSNNNQINNNQHYQNNNQKNIYQNNQINNNQNNQINNNQNNQINNNQNNQINNNQNNIYLYNQINNNQNNIYLYNQNNQINNNQKNIYQYNQNNQININQYYQNFNNNNQYNQYNYQYYQKINQNMTNQNNNNENTQNNNNHNSDLKILEEFKNVPMIGLENLGQTCYMNSVLQCFSNLDYLTNYFLDPSKDDVIKNNSITMTNPEAKSLAIAYKELLNDLWKGKQNIPFPPYKFKRTLGELNTLFKDNNAGDSKDLACYLILQLHQELNLIDSSLNKKAPNNNYINKDNLNVNPYNQMEVFQYFAQDFTLNNSSIISQLFYGVNQNMFECQVCKLNNMQRGITTSLIKYNYENFFFLIFPLDEVRKYKAECNNMGNYYQNINEVDIFDCFNYYQKPNEMNGYCEKCGSNNAKINSVTQIFSTPNILMVIFNRGKGLQFQIKINFPQYLDLRKTILNCNKIYELQSVVKHLGDSSASGHFISYCRSAIPKFHNFWFCYNDNTVVQTNNWKDIHDNGVTYILFYQLKNFNSKYSN